MSDTPRTDAQTWINQYPEYHASATRYVSADFARQLERENAALRSLIDDPNAMHSHYLRECNGWEVWQAERIRRFQDASEQLEQLQRENAALRQQLEDVKRVRYSLEDALTRAHDEATACWEDKERLDWLCEHLFITPAAIDAERKEAQP